VSHLKLATLYESNRLDTVKTLRLIADQVEAGKYGDVGSCAVVMMGNTLEVFGMGPDSVGPTIHLVLCAGAAKFQAALLEHGA
jgi:hypothetical protein